MLNVLFNCSMLRHRSECTSVITTLLRILTIPKWHMVLQFIPSIKLRHQLTCQCINFLIPHQLINLSVRLHSSMLFLLRIQIYHHRNLWLSLARRLSTRNSLLLFSQALNKQLRRRRRHCSIILRQLRSHNQFKLTRTRTCTHPLLLVSTSSSCHILKKVLFVM